MFSFLKKFYSRSQQGGNFLSQIEHITGFPIKDKSLYELAFIHSSSSLESKKGIKLNNERLEFLGDAILGAVITDYLYRNFPDKEEGYLTNLRSKLVSRKHLNEIGENLGLIDLLKYTPSRGTKAKSLNGDAFEALLGALYLDHNYAACQRFIEKGILNGLDIEQVSLRLTSYKSALLEWGQKNRKPVRFELLKTEGQSHNPLYHVGCFIRQQQLGQGSGATKKKAEEAAAKEAHKGLNLPYGEV